MTYAEALSDFKLSLFTKFNPQVKEDGFKPITLPPDYIHFGGQILLPFIGLGRSLSLAPSPLIPVQKWGFLKHQKLIHRQFVSFLFCGRLK